MSRQTAEKNSFPSVNLYKLSDNSVYVDSVFQPDDSEDREFLVFDPLSGNFYTEAQHDDYSPICKPITSEHVHFGLLGILDFHFSKYVFFISDREKVGSISGNDIYRITGVDYVAIGRKVYLSLNEEQFESESLFILKRILSSGWFHYSYTYNLAESMQKQSESWNMSEEAVEKSGGVQDNRFIWNWELLECLAEENLNHFIVPIICGFASTSRISNEELPISPISCSLITRVDKSRVGRRWYCRGIDSRGNAAFTCESELILSSNQISTSSIQLRGSVPVPWRQVPATFESKPRIQIPSLDESTLSAVRRNVYQLIELYGDCITFLNLLDDEWEEKDLVHLYQQSMTMLNDERLHYLHHRICDKNRECYESIRPVVEPIVGTTGCFVADQDRGIVYQSQNGVIRTNCLDSLDRTNLVQFFISNEF
ncbi:SacI homology domain-containing protein [Paraphysoderma sedebokerense]|nr:SacI homology domain-containing protein [Paraphysoderma sedebokerense]